MSQTLERDRQAYLLVRTSSDWDRSSPINFGKIKIRKMAKNTVHFAFIVRVGEDCKKSMCDAWYFGTGDN